MNRKHFALLALGALISAGIAGCSGGGGGGGSALGGSGGGGEMAKVEGLSISGDEFVAHLKSKPTVRVSVQGTIVEADVASSLAFQAMHDLVIKKIMVTLAKEAKVEPTDAQVDEEIKFRNELTPGFIQQLKDRGMSTAQIRREMYYALVSERLLTKGITVPMTEVEDYIKKNPKAFIEPAMIVADIIMVRDAPSKDKAEAQFKSGASFDTVKQRFDQSPANIRSGFDQGVQSGKGIPVEEFGELKSAVTATQPGSITKWIPLETGGGFAKVKVIKKIAEKKIDMTPQRKQFVQREMMKSRGAQSTDLQERIAKKMREADIQVNDETLKEQWKQFLEGLKKQGGGAAGTTGG